MAAAAAVVECAAVEGFAVGVFAVEGDAVGGVAPNGENKNAPLAGIDLSSISTDMLIAHCSAMERKAHMAEIPSHRNTNQQSTAKKRGSRQSSRAEKYRRD